MYYSLLGLRGRRGREVGRASWVPCSRTWGSLGACRGQGPRSLPAGGTSSSIPPASFRGALNSSPGVPERLSCGPSSPPLGPSAFTRVRENVGVGRGVQPAHRCVRRQLPVQSLCFYVYKNKAEDTKACPASTGLGVSGFSGHLPEGPCARPAVPSWSWQDFSRKELCIHSPDPGPGFRSQPQHSTAVSSLWAPFLHPRMGVSLLGALLAWLVRANWVLS